MNEHDQHEQSTHVPAYSAQAPMQTRTLNGIKIPMLISGIFHCLIAMSWFSTCFLFFIGIPLLVLGIFEIMMSGKLNAPAHEQNALRERCKTYAILDICSILLFNLPSMVCGIIQLSNHRQFDEQ